MKLGDLWYAFGLDAAWPERFPTKGVAVEAAAKMSRGEKLTNADCRALAAEWEAVVRENAEASSALARGEALSGSAVWTDTTDSWEREQMLQSANGLDNNQTTEDNVLDEVIDANGQVVQRTLRNRNDPNDPANWTPEQRRIAGLTAETAPELAPESLRPDDPVVVHRRAASDAESASRMKPVGDVEADRASRFRKAAVIDDLLSKSKEVARVLEEAKGLLKEARGLADRLRDANMVQSVQDLEDKVQQIEDSIDGIVDGL